MAAPEIRVAFVYPNPRSRLAAEVRAGTAPDTWLLGQNHLHRFGIDSFMHDPLLSRRELRGGAHRVAWHLRELTLPFELRRTDAVYTMLANFLPFVSRFRRLPVVVQNFGLNLIVARSSRTRRRLLARSLSSAAHVLCTAEAQRDELIDLTGLPADQVSVVHFGVDERFFTAARPADGGHVLSVGRDLARDYATLFAAASGLDARVVVVAHQRNLEGLTVPPNVELRGGLSYDELRSLYAGAACVALTFRPDGFPYGSEASGLTALLEAMASGRAVITSDRSVLRDYVRPDEDALVVPPEDPAALREALERALGDGMLSQRLGRAARASVEERFTTRHQAARLAPVLAKAASH